MRLQGLHIYDFSHTGLHLRAGRDVDVVSCLIGPPAASLPFGSVLGIAALPPSGLEGMDVLLQRGRASGHDGGLAPPGPGLGLRFQRTSVSLRRRAREALREPSYVDFPARSLGTATRTCCVAPPGFSAVPPARPTRAPPPCVTDTGFRLNASSCEEKRDPWELPTAHPGRLSVLRGTTAASSAATQPSQAEALGTYAMLMTGLGAHGLVVGGWAGTTGASTELSVEMDHDYSDAISSIAGQSAEGRRRRWGPASVRLVLGSDSGTVSEDPEAPVPYADELTRVPLSIKHVQVLQSPSTPSSWVPGARGSYVLC